MNKISIICMLWMANLLLNSCTVSVNYDEKSLPKNSIQKEKDQHSFIARPKQVTAGFESNFTVSISNDYKWIYYTSDKKDNKDIWRKRINGGYPEQLTFHKTSDFSPSVSPNGKYVAFVSRRVDAVGDIHILENKGLAGKFFSRDSANEFGLENIGREDLDPSWFPDNERIVFSSRKIGENDTEIFIANIDTKTIEKIDGILGSSPSVSHDGKRLVFERKGNIYLYSLKDKLVKQLTFDDIVLNGKAKFSKDDSSIIYSRYMDDTNRDGSINADDRSTVWKSNLEKINEKYISQPLTTSLFSSLYPFVNNSNLYFTMENINGLDLYVLPESGQFNASESYEKMLERLHNIYELENKISYIRAMKYKFYNASNTKDLIKTFILEFEVLLKNNLLLESTVSLKQFKTFYREDKSALYVYDLMKIKLENSPFKYPESQLQITSTDIERIDTNINKVESIISSSADNSLILDYSYLTIVELIASKKKYFEANQYMERNLKNISEDKRGYAQLWNALLVKELINTSNAIDSLIKVAKNNTTNLELLRDISFYIQSMANLSENKIELLVDILNKTKSIRYIGISIHLEIADIYLKKGKKLVAINEYREIFKSNIEDRNLIKRAANQLIQLMAEDNRLGELEIDLFDFMEKEREAYDNKDLVSIDLLENLLVKKGRFEIRKNNYEEAVSTFLTMNTLNENSIVASRGLIKSMYYTNTLEDNRKNYKEDADEYPDDPVRLYNYALLLTYDIDKTTDPQDQMSVITDCIEILEKARNIDDQIAYIHQTLGWLYLQKYMIFQKYENLDGISYSVSRRWQIVENFFGFKNVNWLDLALDSFLSAYFLLDDENPDRIDIAMNLGHVYYENKNYQKSLFYYMKRISSLAYIPAENIIIESELYKKSGRSAFHAGQYEIAKEIQLKDVELWSTQDNDQKLSESLERLNLTLVELNELDDSIEVLKKLTRIYQQNGKFRHLNKANLKLAYVYFLKDDQIRSIESIQQYMNFKKSTEIAQIDTQVNGWLGFDRQISYFSELDQDILAEGILANIYKEQNIITKVVDHTSKKIELLKTKIKEESDKGVDIELTNLGLSIACNNLGFNYLNLGNYDKAVEYFNESLKYGKNIVQEADQNNNRVRNINDLVKLNIDQISYGKFDQNQISQTLAKSKEELEKFKKENAKDENIPIEILMLSNNYGILLTAERVRTEFEKDHKINSNAFLTKLDVSKYLQQEEYNIWLRINNPELYRETRRKNLTDNLKAWKIYAMNGEYKQAIEELKILHSSNKFISEDKDRVLIRKLFENEMTGKVEDVNTIQNYINWSLYNEVKRIYSYANENYKEKFYGYFRISEIDEIRENLRDNQTLVVFYENLKKERTSIFISKQNQIDINVSKLGSDFDFISQSISKYLGKYKDINQLIILPANELFDIDYEKILVNRNINFSFIPFLEAVKYLNSEEIQSKSFLSFFKDFETFKVGNYKLIKPERINLIDELDTDKNISIVNLPVELYEANFSSSVVKLPTGDVPIVNLFTKNKKSQILSIFTELKTYKNNQGKISNHNKSWALLSTIGIINSMKSMIIPYYSETIAEMNIEQFINKLDNLNISDSTKVFKNKVRIIGVTNINKLDVDEHIEKSIELAEEQEDDDNPEGAVPYYQEAYYGNLLAGNKDESSKILTKLRNIHFKGENFKQALFFQTLLKEQFPKNSVEYHKFSLDEASLAMRANSFKVAKELIENCIVYFKKVDELELLARSWKEKAIYEELNKNPDESLKNYKKSLEIYEEDDNAQMVAQTMLNIGNIYNIYFSKFSEAIEYYNKSSEMFKNMEKYDDFYRIQIDKANAYNKMGLPEEAVKILALNFTKISRENDLLTWIRTAQGLTNGYYLSGDRERAKKYNTITLEAIDDLVGKSKQIVQKIEALNMKGMILGQNGDYEKLKQTYSESLQLAIESKNKFLESDVYNNLGYWEREFGNIESSITYMEKALSIDIDMNSERNLAYDYRNLALSLIYTNTLGRSRNYLVKSLEISKKLNLIYNEIHSYLALGQVEIESGNFGKAKEYFEHSLKISTENSQSEFIWKSLIGLSDVSGRLNDNQNVVKYLNEAVELVESETSTLKIFNHETWLYSNIGIREVYDKLIDVYMESKEFKKAWDLSARARKQFSKNEFRNKLEMNENLELNALKDLQAEISKIEKRKIVNGSIIESEKSRLLELKSKESEFLVKIKEIKPGFMALLSSSKISLEEILSNLKSDETLIDYWISNKKLYIWTLNSDAGLKSFVVDRKRSYIERLVTDFQEIVMNYSSMNYIINEASSVLLDPLVDELNNTKHLIILPDRYLHYLPYSVLKSENNYLIDQFSISYLDNYDSFRRLKSEQPILSKNILIGTDSGDNDRLYFVNKEAESIKRYFKNSDIINLKSENSKKKFLESLDRYDIIHLATHGEFNSIDPMKSFLKFGQETLEVSELFNLNINTELVTLSACESGISNIENGMEMIGMNQSLLLSGTKSVISNLWRVNDVSSAMAMKRFYRYLNEGYDKSEALRKSQLVVKKYFEHPAFWASFKLTGSRM